MKVITLAAASVLCAAIILSAADKPAPPPASSESEAKSSAPAAPIYRVISAPAPGAVGESEKVRKSFEETLNKAHAEGYEFAGMNNNWVVLEHSSPPLPAERRRVVLPTP